MAKVATAATRPARLAGSALEVFLAFLRLGCTSFGGPVAHLGYFRAEFVERRHWLDERGLRRHRGALPVPPGPGQQPDRLMIGMLRAGLPGGVAAWLGFTRPRRSR